MLISKIYKYIVIYKYFYILLYEIKLYNIKLYLYSKNNLKYIFYIKIFIIQKKIIYYKYNKINICSIKINKIYKF